MNIFVLSRNPIEAARMHCDKHVVKMIVESSQMLSTAHRVLDGVCHIERSKSNRNVKRYRLDDYREHILYKATHVNHPSNIWTRESSANYVWHYHLFVELCEQFTLRYGKIHKTDRLLRRTLERLPDNIDWRGGLTPFRLAINVPECIQTDPVRSYRMFYKTKQSRFNMKWTKIKQPEWFYENSYNI